MYVNCAVAIANAKIGLAFLVFFAAGILGIDGLAANRKTIEQIEPVEIEMEIFGRKVRSFKLALPFFEINENNSKNITFLPQNGVGVINKKTHPEAMLVSGPFFPCLAIIIESDERIVFSHLSLNNQIKDIEKFVDTAYSKDLTVTLYSLFSESQNESYKTMAQVKNAHEFVDKCMNDIDHMFPNASTIKFKHGLVPVETLPPTAIFGIGYLVPFTILVNAQGKIFHANLIKFFPKLNAKFDSYYEYIEGHPARTKEEELTLIKLCENAADKSNTMLREMNMQFITKDHRILNTKDKFELVRVLLNETQNTPKCSAPSSESNNCCAVCEKPASKKCSRCKAISYCGEECQKKDWGWHKKNCKAPELPQT